MQYHKALIGMQGLLKDPTTPLDVVLVCSLVCIHFESLRESFVPALMHVENAIQLLQSRTKFDARKVNPALVRAMMRMDLQGTMYLGSRVPGLPFVSKHQWNLRQTLTVTLCARSSPRPAIQYFLARFMS